MWYPSQMPEDLRQFIALLRRNQQIVEIETEVDPVLEAAEIHRRVIAAGGPALLFKRIKNSPYPLVTNLFGDKKRVELAFGTRPEKLVAQIAKLPEELVPPSLSKLWQKRSLIADLTKIGLKRSNSAPVMEVKEAASLDSLPLLTTWAEDGGPFVTLPLVYTEHPATKIGNLGMYRIQRYNNATTGLHFQIGKGGGFHLEESWKAGKPLPVVINIGGPPAAILAAIAPLPENVPELLLASLVLGKKLRLTDTETPMLGNAEFALVGEARPNEWRAEGPFGDHYGYYSLKHDYPVFHCRNIYRRKDPICAATVVGKPRQEDFYIGDYLQELLSPLIKIVMPGVVDIWAYGETGYHSLAAAIVKERYKREAMVSAFRILGEGQLALTKFLLLTDKAMNLRNFRAVLEHVLERADFRTDLYLFGSLSMDTLDYNGPAVNRGSKGVLLGLGDPIRQLPENPPVRVDGAKNIAKFCRGCLVIDGPSKGEDPGFAERIISDRTLSEWPLIVLVDDAKRAAKDEINFLWHTFTRFEPAADIYAAKKTIVRNQISYDGPILIDARLKPDFPKELFCDPATKELVSKRWKEYFPKTNVEMGDSDIADL